MNDFAHRSPRPLFPKGHDPDIIEGEVTRVVFRNDGNGYSVLRVSVEGISEPLSVVGQTGSVAEGEHVSARGGWEENTRFGWQFKATRLETRPPTSVDGLQRYLSSSQMKGIGPVYATRLVEAFGDKVLEVIENEPDRLGEVAGIGETKKKQILDTWQGQRFVQDIMVFLHGLGFGPARVSSILKTYGDDTIERIRSNPYRLITDIHGIGFLIADRAALSLGIETNDPIRLQAGIFHTLNEAAKEDGHCGLPEAGEDGIVAQGAKKLSVDQSEVAGALTKAIKAEVVKLDLMDGVQGVFLRDLYAAERAIADGIARLLQEPLPWAQIDAEASIDGVQDKTGIELSGSQREALVEALRSKVIVITGGPGVGKTTIVKSLLEILRTREVSLELCAPTGRAANRLGGTTGVQARTIHRLLEFDPRNATFRRNQEHPLECDLVIVDEVSMVDVLLMSGLVGALASKTALVLVGDVDQLPSVGPGHVLGNIIESGVVPVARLAEVHRQAATSQIITSAHKVNRGEEPEFVSVDQGGDCIFVDAQSPMDGASKIVKIVAERIPERFRIPPSEVQVLSPMRKGPLGTEALNQELRARLNPDAPRIQSQGGAGFSINDKVMQTENNYEKEVYNGDIGIIREIDLSSKDIVVEINGQMVTYTTNELGQIALAYAITIHKSQGSEYPAVVVPLTTQHFIMLRRNLLYTAITRAKKLVVLVGQRKALHKAIRENTGRRRYSKLREMLETAVSQ